MTAPEQPKDLIVNIAQTLSDVLDADDDKTLISLLDGVLKNERDSVNFKTHIMVGAFNYPKCLAAILKRVDFSIEDMLSNIEPAAENGGHQCIKILLDEIGKKQALIPENERTLSQKEDFFRFIMGACRLAAKNGHARCIEMMEPLIDWKQPWFGTHPIIEAIKENHAECVSVLVRRYDLKKNNSEMLRNAVARGRMDIARMLFKDSDPESAADAFLRAGPAAKENHEKLNILIQEFKLKERVGVQEKKHRAGTL